MGNQLNTFTVAKGYNLIALTEIDSTNLEARRQLTNDAVVPLWIVASLQLQGRGRRGNKWVSPSGNLYCSLLLPMEKSLAETAELSFVMANALHKTLISAGLDPERVKTKWPNDILVDGKKISGILLEIAENKEKEKHIIIGVGVNIMHSPSASDYHTICLKSALGSEMSLSNFFNELADKFKLDYQEWSMTGFEFARGYWLQNSIGIGKKIVVRLPNKELNGIFSGLSVDGALLLKTDDGNEIPIYAGDVFFSKN